MKTLKEIKAILTSEDGKNTILGMHINSLEKNDRSKYNCAVQSLELAIEIFAQMEKNGIDVFKDTYKLGNVSKAYFQVKLNEFSNY